ncbi:acyltransferase [Ferruginibacter sp. HRS2-29]|uniref:acyltransferase family protein n=1 Tax=Ferruginibacter sp. HRS2-29 TaxID=2487334 RepID=UPI0020CF6143|nr:acyltransferase [Ferruginibacter sp. HRS2-29]MCP9751935.1 acyltransferase [Ferruginibacter sp. HRS2-29]
MNDQKYFSGIDGLRCVAILLVLLEHFPPWIGKYISAGYYGVDLFFVISGFLITRILCKSRETSFFKAYGIFMGRRTLRIFPVYYFAILVLYILQYPVIREYLVYFVTYTYNYAWVYYKIPVSDVHHFWSLCVEEQFYLFWPLVVLGLRKKQQILLVVIAAIVSVGFLQTTLDIFPSLSPYNGAGILTRMASLGLGAFGAVYTLNYKLPEKLFRSVLLECLVLLLVLPLSLVFFFKLKPVVLGLVSLYLVLKAAFFGFRIGGINKFLHHRFVLYIASISYGIYVYHGPIQYYLNEYAFSPIWNSIDFSFFPVLEFHPWIFKLPLYLAITIGFAALSMRFLERPLLKLKDRLFK